MGVLGTLHDVGFLGALGDAGAIGAVYIGDTGVP